MSKKYQKTMKLLMSLILFFSLLGTSISALTAIDQWSKPFGGKFRDELESIQQTSDGGFISAGVIESKQYSNTTTSYGWILKTDRDGTQAWSKQYGESESREYLYDVQQTSDGGYIAVGYTDGSVNGNPSFGGQDGWILKVASDGTQEWSKQYGGTGSDRLASVQQTSDGGYIAAGYDGTSGFDGWVIKVSSDGTQEWSKKFVASGWNFLNGIQISNDGNFIVAGQKARGIFSDGWIMKLSNAGDELWSKTYAGTSNQYLRSIFPTSDGGYIAAGEAQGQVGDQPNLGFIDGWILKVSADGTTEWSKQYGSAGSERLYSIQQTSDGNYLAAGYTTGNVGKDVNLGLEDGWLLRIANDGTELWSRQFGGTSNDYFNATIQTKEGDYMVAGGADSSSNIGGNPGLGNRDGWIAKITDAYELSFELNDADSPAIDKQIIAFNQPASAVVEPTKQGYRFVEWQDELGVTWDFELSLMPDHDVILYAQWEEVFDLLPGPDAPIDELPNPDGIQNGGTNILTTTGQVLVTGVIVLLVIGAVLALGYAVKEKRK